MKIPHLSPIEIEALRASFSPWPHYSQDWKPALIIHRYSPPKEAIPEANLFPEAGPLLTIHDFSGYLCTTQSTEVLLKCLTLEAFGGSGTLRSLITGEPLAHLPEPEKVEGGRLPDPPKDLPSLTLDDLQLTLPPLPD